MGGPHDKEQSRPNPEMKVGYQSVPILATWRVSVFRCVSVRLSVRPSVRPSVRVAYRGRDCVVVLRVYRRDLSGTIKWLVHRSVWSVGHPTIRRNETRRALYSRLSILS